MSVADLCSRNVVTVRAVDNVVVAAKLMREHHVGYTVVVEDDFTASTQRPVGVLTDRDIVVATVARDRDPRGMTVREVMTPNPVAVKMTESLAGALREMRRVGVRRMPVVGEVGELVGVLSIDQILGALSGGLADLVGALRHGQQFETTLRTG